MKNKKGFTLIELLAVIVVLAIVMVLAASTVLPMINEARKNAFATEVNSSLDAAQNAVALIRLGSKNGPSCTNCYKYTAATETAPAKYCFTLEGLQEMQLLDKDLTDYSGKITINVPSTGAYTYAIYMRSKTHYVENIAVPASKDNVTEGSKTTTYKCS